MVVKPAGIEPFGEPLSYNGEFVEVTDSNTVHTRYHSKDFQTDLAFYLARAKQASQGRTPGVIRIREVFIKHLDIIARNPGNPGGKIREATCEIPAHFITEYPEYEKLYADNIFSNSKWGGLAALNLPNRSSSTTRFLTINRRMRQTSGGFIPSRSKRNCSPTFRT